MREADSFFDTNVLLYLLSKDAAKADRAEMLLAAGGVVSVQVLNEFVNVTRRKLHWEWGQIAASLAVVEELLGPGRALTAAIHRKALVLARDHALAFYDALIVAAALDAGCDELCSEDLQHGQRFGALTIDNPFRRGTA